MDNAELLQAIVSLLKPLTQDVQSIKDDIRLLAENHMNLIDKLNQPAQHLPAGGTVFSKRLSRFSCASFYTGRLW